MTFNISFENFMFLLVLEMFYIFYFLKF